MPKRAIALTFVLASSLAGCSGARDTSMPGLTPALPEQSHARYSAPQGKKKPVPTMYVADRDGAAVLGYPSTANGNIAPTVTLAGANTQITNPVALAVDAQGNLYVGNDSAQQILIFPAGSNGNATPQVLGGSNVPLTASEGVAIDNTGQIYVSDFRANQILVFPAGSSGNVAPSRTIVGAATNLSEPIGMAFDSSNNLYVANYGGAGPAIVEFAPTANGNVQPIGSLGAAGGGKANLYAAFDVRINANDDIIVGNESENSIDIFKHGADGNVKPNAIISGGATGLSEITSTGLDAKGFIYVTNYEGSSSEVLVFAPSAKGNAAPVRTFIGSNTGLSDPFYPTFH